MRQGVGLEVEVDSTEGALTSSNIALISAPDSPIPPSTDRPAAVCGTEI